MTNDEIRAIVTNEMLPEWMKWEDGSFVYPVADWPFQVPPEIAEAAIVGHLVVALAGHELGICHEDENDFWVHITINASGGNHHFDAKSLLAALAAAWRATR